MASSIDASTSGAGGVITTADNSGSLDLKSGGTTIATVSSTGLSLATGKTLSVGGVTSSPYTMKNRIINGDMRIDQRNAGASVTNGTGDTFPVDRFLITGQNASKFTAQQNAGSVTPPAGYVNYLGCTSSAATSLGASDYYLVRQSVEGLNVADLDWGTANAKTITISFWVRSSLTGTFGGSLFNSAVNRSYPFSYTISAANTWEQKSITIAGDTTGTWLKTNGVGIYINWSLGTGTTLSGTSGSWSSTAYVSSTGATSVVGVSGATFYLTGVQLEVGSSATQFEWRPYTTELQLCQRYYQKFTGTSGNAYCGFAFGSVHSTSIINVLFKYTTTMRAAPTVSISALGTQVGAGTVYAINSINTLYIGADTTYGSLNTATTTFTFGQAASVVANNSTTGYVDFTAEL